MKYKNESPSVLAAKTAGFKLISTNRMVVTTGETGWGKENEGKGGQIQGDQRRLDFRWGKRNRVYMLYYKVVY